MNESALREYIKEHPFAKLSDVVSQMLYDAIVVLDIPPASKLNINQIAADLGISRTPVAEAVSRLQNIGFVEQHSGSSGFFVVDMTMPDMIDLYRARSAIESEAAAICAQLATIDDIARLESLAAEFKKAIPRRDGSTLKETDMPFHKLIVETCGNKYLIENYSELLPHLTMYQCSWVRFIDPNGDNPWSSRVVHQHNAIVSAIKMRLPDLARQAMAEHITDSLSFVTYSENTADPFSTIKRPSGK